MEMIGEFRRVIDFPMPGEPAPDDYGLFLHQVQSLVPEHMRMVRGISGQSVVSLTVINNDVEVFDLTLRAHNDSNNFYLRLPYGHLVEEHMRAISKRDIDGNGKGTIMLESVSGTVWDLRPISGNVKFEFDANLDQFDAVCEFFLPIIRGALNL